MPNSRFTCTSTRLRTCLGTAVYAVTDSSCLTRDNLVWKQMSSSYKNIYVVLLHQSKCRLVIIIWLNLGAIVSEANEARRLRIENLFDTSPILQILSIWKLQEWDVFTKFTLFVSHEIWQLVNNLECLLPCNRY